MLTSNEQPHSIDLRPEEFTCSRCRVSFLRTDSRQRRCQRCKDRHAEEERRRRAKSPEKIAVANRRYRSANREALKERDRLRYQQLTSEQHAENLARQKRAWWQNTAEKRAARQEQLRLRALGRRERQRAISRRMYWSNPVHGRVSAAVRRMLRGRKARRGWEELVGYSAEQLREHIERQFLPGMSWDNATEWHIDHIVPVSLFSFASAEDDDFKACWALTNLRPLWARDNARKQAKRTHLI